MSRFVADQCDRRLAVAVLPDPDAVRTLPRPASVMAMVVGKDAVPRRGTQRGLGGKRTQSMAAMVAVRRRASDASETTQATQRGLGKEKTQEKKRRGSLVGAGL